MDPLRGAVSHMSFKSSPRWVEGSVGFSPRSPTTESADVPLGLTAGPRTVHTADKPPATARTTRRNQSHFRLFMLCAPSHTSIDHGDRYIAGYRTRIVANVVVASLRAILFQSCVAFATQLTRLSIDRCSPRCSVPNSGERRGVILFSRKRQVLPRVATKRTWQPLANLAGTSRHSPTWATWAYPFAASCAEVPHVATNG